MCVHQRMVCGVGDRALRGITDCFVFEAKARQRKSQPWGRLEAMSYGCPQSHLWRCMQKDPLLSAMTRHEQKPRENMIATALGLASMPATVASIDSPRTSLDLLQRWRSHPGREPEIRRSEESRHWIDSCDPHKVPPAASAEVALGSAIFRRGFQLAQTHGEGPHHSHHGGVRAHLALSRHRRGR